MSALDWALEVAQHGMRVFPCFGVVEVDGRLIDEETGSVASKADGSGKRPRVRWKDVATTDPEQITAWFEQWPHSNYGVVLGEGFVVVDCDSEEASDRFELAWQENQYEDAEGEIELEECAIRTFTVRTARGYHYYLAGDSLTFRPSPEVDLKGAGGYVVGPGSLSWAGTRYEATTDAVYAIAAAPDWVVKHDRVSQLATSTQHLRITEERNNALTRVAGSLMRMGLPRDVVKQAVLGVNQLCCSEPLEVDELVQTVFTSVDTWEYGQSMEAQLDFSAMRAAMENTTIEQVAQERFFTMRSDRAMWQEPEWVVRGHLQHEGLVQLHGPSYTGKTFVAIDLAMAFANHLPWLGQAIEHKQVWDEHAREDVAKDHVLYVLSEGAFDLRQRLEAWCAVRGEGSDERVITIVEKALDLSSVEDWTRIAEQMVLDERVERLRHRIGLIIIDTQSMLLDVDENANRDMSQCAVVLRGVAKTFGATILLVHHDGHEGPHRIGGRGASAFGAAMDTTIKLSSGERGVVSIAFAKVKGAQVPHAANDPYAVLFVQHGDSAAVSADDMVAIRGLRAAGNDNVEAARQFLASQPDRTATQVALCDGIGIRYNARAGSAWSDLRDAMVQLPEFEEGRAARGNGSTWTFSPPDLQV